MKLDSKTEVKGTFWLPESSDKTTGGTLTIDVDGSANLELVDRVSADFEQYFKRLAVKPGESIPPTRIMGRVDKFNGVTLDYCYEKSMSSNLFGASPTSYFVGRVLTDVHMDQEEIFHLNELQFTMEGLDEWIGSSGFDIDRSGNRLSSWIHYNVPKDIPVTKFDDVKITFTYQWWSPGWTTTQTEAVIRQEAMVSLKTANPKPIDDLITMASRLRDLISLGVGRPLLFTSITGYSDELSRKLDDGGLYQTPIKIYYDDRRRVTTNRITGPKFMPFTLSCLNDDISTYFRAWLEIYAEHEGAISSYFVATADTSIKTGSRFVSMFQVIETLHRATSTETKMPKNEVRTKIKEIREQFATDQQFARIVGYRVRTLE